MKTSWGTKSPHKRKRSVLRTKVRWERLGLQDPSGSPSGPTIEDLRRQITSAARQGLSNDTRSRSQQTDSRQKAGAKLSVTARKRGPTAS